MPRNLTYWSAATGTLKDSPQFEVQAVQGSEALGELFHYTVVLQTPDSPDLTALVAANLPYKQMVGHEAGLVIEVDGGGQRELNGLVTSARFLHAQDRRSLYEVTLEPWLVLATRSSDHRVFQHLNVIEISQQLLADYPYLLELRVSQRYPARDFQVQYGETDFAFLSRLWQEWGIYYFFEHAGGKHRLVLVDDAGAHRPCAGVYAQVAYHPAGAQIEAEYCDALQTHEGLQSGAWVTDDFDFRKPRARLQHKVKMPRKTGHADLEHFRWPGDFVNPSLPTDPEQGRDVARSRMEEAGAAGQRAFGTGNLRGITVGSTFVLSRHPQHKANADWLVIATSLSLRENSHAAGEEGYSAHCQFQLQPAGNTFRSPQSQPKPLTTGPQTAIVTGPPGEEIYTDQYGRVKVSFHWNRYCSKDHNSSCWVRVSSPWAGSNFGGIAIPRIGQEVIVDFENGDPDKPLITGRVYNALNMPPWDLPANMTQSGIKTKSTLGGAPGAGLKDGAGDTNVLRFEDKKGQEQLWLHAQKDQLTEVENDEDKWVGQDRRKVIDRDEFNTIHRDRTEVVDRNEKINVHGWRTEEVDLDETITIHKNRTETVDLNETITIHKNRAETVDLNETIGIGVNRTEKVGNNEAITIGTNRTKTVGRNETDKIGSTWKIRVGKMKMETIGIANMENIGVARMTNIGMVDSLNVGLLMNTIVGGQQSTQVGSTKSLKVGRDYTLDIGANKTETVGAVAVYQAGTQLVLQCGAAKIVLDESGGIYLEGSHIEMRGGGAIHGDADNIKWNCGAAQAAPAASPPPPPAVEPLSVPAEAGSSLADAFKALKGAADAAKQVMGLVTTVKAAAKGDIGAIAGLVGMGSGIGSGLLGGGSGGNDGAYSEAEMAGTLGVDELSSSEPAATSSGYWDNTGEGGWIDTASPDFSAPLTSESPRDLSAYDHENAFDDGSFQALMNSGPLVLSDNAANVFTTENLMAMPNWHIEGAGKELGDAMISLGGHRDDDTGQWLPYDQETVSAGIDGLVRLRGMSYEEANRQYSAFYEAVEKREDSIYRDRGQKLIPFVEGGPNENRVPMLSMQDTGKLPDNRSHMGSIEQLRFGKMVGDSLGGLDPVFGALLSPTGGIPGAGNDRVTNPIGLAAAGGLEVVTNHGIAHDAAGYLRNFHSMGPGYQYVPGVQGLLSTSNPLAGQSAGLQLFNNVKLYGLPNPPRNPYEN